MSPSPQNVHYVDAKEHYESLIALFKSHFNKTIIFITAIIVITAALTYKSISDAKEDMMKNIKSQVDVIKNNVENDAKQQASDKIKEIFEQKNVVKYISEQMDASIEPKIKDLIVKQNEAYSLGLIDQAIADIQSQDPLTRLGSISFLVVAPYSNLNGQHLDRLISIARDQQTDAVTKANIAGVLARRPSGKTTEFFKQALLEYNPVIQFYAMSYLVQPEIPQDDKLYFKFIKNNPKQREQLFRIARQKNPQLAKELEKALRN